MTMGEEYLIGCKGTGGIPTPELVASVGPERLANGEADMLLEAMEESYDGVTGGNVQKLFKYYPNSDYRYGEEPFGNIKHAINYICVLVGTGASMSNASVTSATKRRGKTSTTPSPPSCNSSP